MLEWEAKGHRVELALTARTGKRFLFCRNHAIMATSRAGPFAIECRKHKQGTVHLNAVSKGKHPLDNNENIVNTVRLVDTEKEQAWPVWVQCGTQEGQGSMLQ